MRRITIVLGLLTMTAACGGGGGGSAPGSNAGGGGGGGGTTGHGSILPADPGGLGVAGSMDGLWKVSAAQLLSTPAPKGNPTSPCACEVGDKVRLENGKLVAVNDEDPREPPDNTTNQIPFKVDFFANESGSNVVKFCVGFTLLDNPFFGSGTVQMGMVGGTTTATIAKARLYCVEQIRDPKIPNMPTIDQFGAWDLTLERITP